MHCVIVGFSFNKKKEKYIFDNGHKEKVDNINSYLLDAPNVFVQSRSNPICKVPPMRFGSMPRDGGGFILTDEEKELLVKKEPLSIKWIKLYLGSHEYINSKTRWCLWLVDADPTEIKQCPIVMDRIEKVRQFRLNSIAAGTRKFASTPTLFCQIAQPKTNYIVVPKVSSERRAYIPIGFLTPDVIASDLLFVIPDATLYHFGILTSKVHMAWMRAFSGRLKSDYRYSKDIVYNNFPWPEPTEIQTQNIEDAARRILDVRATYSGSSLSDLYDPRSMPPDLVKAHEGLDRAVASAYGVKGYESEDEVVAFLMDRYQELV